MDLTLRTLCISGIIAVLFQDGSAVSNGTIEEHKLPFTPRSVTIRSDNLTVIINNGTNESSMRAFAPTNDPKLEYTVFYPFNSYHHRGGKNLNITLLSGRSDDVKSRIVNHPELYQAHTLYPGQSAEYDIAPQPPKHNSEIGTETVECYCIPYYLCKDGVVNSGGRQIELLRIARNLINDSNRNETINNGHLLIQATVKQSTATTKKCESDKVCCQISFTDENHLDDNHYPVATPQPDIISQYPSGFPDNNPQYPSRFPDSNSQYPSRFPELYPQYPSSLSGGQPQYPSSFPGDQSQYPSYFTEGQPQYPSSFPGDQPQYPSSFPERYPQNPSSFPGHPQYPSSFPGSQPQYPSIFPERYPQNPSSFPGHPQYPSSFPGQPQYPSSFLGQPQYSSSFPERYPQNPSSFPAGQPQSEHCGVRRAYGIQGRLQNLLYASDVTEFGEYPWQVAVLKRVQGDKSLYLCGGVLISSQWVATAAHCIKQAYATHLQIRLGEWDVNRMDEIYPYLEEDVETIVSHPEFDPGTLQNDIALIRMRNPVSPHLPHVTPACLPQQWMVFDGQRCWVSGWGKNFFGPQGEYQNVLKEVDVPIMPYSTCETELRSTQLGQNFRLHPGFLCAGGEPGKDACTGDGGSPLVCENEGIGYVVGIVSWGIGCGHPRIPGVYVNIVYYSEWINEIIWR